MSEYVEECKRKPIGLYDPRFEHDNCGIGAIVNIKGKKTHSTVKNALEIVANQEKTAKEKQEMVLVFSYRFLISFSVKWQKSLVLTSEESVNMVSVCSFSHRMS